MSERRIEVQEISFREWIVCKVKQIQSGVTLPSADPEKKQTKQIKARSGGDRRIELVDQATGGKEWRRLPERRMPEVNKASFDEFERWRK